MSTCGQCFGCGLVQVGGWLVGCPLCGGTGTLSEGAEDDRGRKAN